MARLKEEQETASSPTLQKQVVNSLFFFFQSLINYDLCTHFFLLLGTMGICFSKTRNICPNKGPL